LLEGSELLNLLDGVGLQLFEISHINLQIRNGLCYFSIHPFVTFGPSYRIVLVVFDTVERPAPFSNRYKATSTPKMAHIAINKGFILFVLLSIKIHSALSNTSTFT